MGPEPITIEVLGPIRIRGAQSNGLTRPALRRLLAILALEGDQITATDRLIDRFWPDGPPSTAKAALHTHVSSLRNVIGHEVIFTEADGYRIPVESAVLDSDRFISLAAGVAASARDRLWDEALRDSDEALALWRGSPFHELRDDDFAYPARARLSETYLELCELRAEALLGIGRPEAALPELEGLVIENPVRERLWEHLMTARYRMGRHREALSAFQEASDYLAEIGLEPGLPLQGLEERILLHDRNLTGTPHNLPVELDSFVGRESVMGQVADLLADSRLVTLTGAGGSGKTRTAVRTAKGLFDRFRDGIWFVELEGLDDSRLVSTEAAIAIGLRPHGNNVLSSIIDAIDGRKLLLILDNCEHVLEGASSFVADLLRASKSAKVLATSRAPLRIRGETIFPLRGMEVPAESASVSEAAELEAVRLFISRAGQSDPTRPITADQIPTVTSITKRLDGLPLAIELAAARAGSMSLQDLDMALEDATRLLTGGAGMGHHRHKTLNATVEWSYRLLNPVERTVFEQLSVFRGGFDFDTIDQVVSVAEMDGPRIRATVLDLVEQSLVESYQTKPVSRFRLLEPLRQFGQARLADSDDGSARGRHLLWSVHLCTDVWHNAAGGDRAGIARTLETEVENLQYAREWARARTDIGAISMLSQALAWHWYFSGHLDNARQELIEAKANEIDEKESVLVDSLLARCLAYSEDIDASVGEAERAVTRLSQVDSDLLAAWVISTLQLTLFMSVRSDPATMLPLAKRALQLAEETPDLRAEVIARQVVADAYCWNGRTAAGLEQQRLALTKAAATEDLSVIGDIYGQSIYNFMLDPVERRTEPARVVGEWLQLTEGEDVKGWASAATDWLPWVYLQTGALDRAAEASGRLESRILKGYNRTIHLIVQASISWIAGNLNAAGDTIARLGAGGVSERWWHVYYPLAVEIAVDRHRQDEAVELASAYRSLQVHRSREAAKLGVLAPLVRGHVDEALRTESAEAAESARASVEQMRSILAECPPLVESWTSIMTHTQNLAFAEAELSRLSGSDRHLWAKALEAADHSYYRLYARWRLAEADLRAGRTDEAARELTDVDRLASAMGARLMIRRIRETAAQYGVSSRS